jgi:hydroxyethylthiazole kinase
VTRGATIEAAEKKPVEPDLDNASEGMSKMVIHHEKSPAHTTAALLKLVRTKATLVQCITNTVVTNFTANVLLALGVAPAMVDIPTEAGLFAATASGVLINTGTPHAETRVAMIEAATAAGGKGTPWVLDPVAVGSLPIRTAVVEQLLALQPTIIRGNPSEIMALAGFGSGPRGVDSTDVPEDAVPAAIHVATTYGSVVAISGPRDVITDGDTIVRINNGHHLLTRITGGGCALGAVIAAFASLSSNRLDTTVAACAVYTIAAELAAETAQGPGSFATLFLDNLDRICEDDVLERLAIA